MSVSQDLPVDPVNPLGYKHITPDFDHINRPCMDFHHSLAWIFWRSNIIREHGNFEHVRHLRHTMLLGLENRGCQVQKITTPTFDYDIEVGESDGNMGIMISAVSANRPEDDRIFCHVLSKMIIIDTVIQGAIMLNRNLQDVALDGGKVSPFGPSDIVRPGNFDYRSIKSGKIIQPTRQYRSIRLMPEFSWIYQEAMESLSRAEKVIHIQGMLGTLPLIEMPINEFNRFIHFAAARVHKLSQNNQI